MPENYLGAIFDLFAGLGFESIFEHLNFAADSTFQCLLFLLAGIKNKILCVVIKELVVHVEIDPGQDLKQ